VVTGDLPFRSHLDSVTPSRSPAFTSTTLEAAFFSEDRSFNHLRTLSCILN
jgi:hypothetical protein